MGDKDETQGKFYIVNGNTMQEASTTKLSSISSGKEPEETYQGEIGDFEYSCQVEINKEDHKRLMALFEFTRKEINDMFDAVEHGRIVLFDCEWSYADNENVKYKGVACDTPSALRGFLKEMHYMRMEYKIIKNHYKRKE